MANGNELQMPSQGNGLPSQGNGLQPQQDPISMLSRQHDMLNAQFDKMTDAKGMFDKVRKEMDDLVKLGDTVVPDDVIKAAGRLVGHGLGNAAMAEILATMPRQGGQPLAQWVMQQDQDVRVKEAHLAFAKNQAGHHLAVAGLRMLAADHLRNGPPEGGGPQIQSGAMNLENSLTQQAPTMQ